LYLDQNTASDILHPAYIAADSEQRRLIAVGALAGSAAFLCHSRVDFNWQIPANALYFVTLLVLMENAGRLDLAGE